MNRFAAILAPLTLAGALSACAYDPYPTTAVNAYQGNAYAAAPYATTVPGPIAPSYAQGYAPGSYAPGSYASAPYAPAYATTGRPDPTGYCREAYANYADAQNRAALSGNAVDIGRARNTANFLRRDCG